MNLPLLPTIRNARTPARGNEVACARVVAHVVLTLGTRVGPFVYPLPVPAALRAGATLTLLSRQSFTLSFLKTTPHLDSVRASSLESVGSAALSAQLPSSPSRHGSATVNEA